MSSRSSRLAFLAVALVVAAAAVDAQQQFRPQQQRPQQQRPQQQQQPFQQGQQQFQQNQQGQQFQQNQNQPFQQNQNQPFQQNQPNQNQQNQNQNQNRQPQSQRQPQQQQPQFNQPQQPQQPQRPQQQRPTSEKPFVDEYREYYPDDRKFYFNYTYGDDSKRVLFRSGTPGTADFSGNRGQQQQQQQQQPSRRPTQAAPTRPVAQPIYVADIDSRPYGDNSGAYDGYSYDEPAPGLERLSYERPNRHVSSTTTSTTVAPKRSRLPYKVHFRMFRED